MRGRNFEVNGNTIRGLISAGIAVAALGYFIANSENNDDKLSLPSVPVARPKIDRGEPSIVLRSRQTATGGSRLVLKQCLDLKGCVTETYVSNFPDAATVYTAGSTMELEDVQPPMRFIPQR